MLLRSSFISTLAAIALGSAALLPATGSTSAADITFNVLGVVSTNTTQADVEKEFYENLGKKTGLDIQVNYRNLDVAGLAMEDTLRMVGSGAFDVIESTIGPAARDDTFLEGIDLVGVSPTIEDLRSATEAYRAAFDKRLGERFNGKAMTLWPFGPQVFYCNSSVKSLKDLHGKKVRSYTASMSAVVTALGAVPVTMNFPEVYLALQRGVIDCAITSPTSGSTGKWPEVTKNMIPVGINWAMNVHTMNLNSWNKLSPDQQQKIAAAFKEMEDELWSRAGKVSDDATNCNVGSEKCTGFTKYNMALSKVTDEDREKLKAAVSSTVLPEWSKACNQVYPECSKVWNDTVGKARGFQIAE